MMMNNTAGLLLPQGHSAIVALLKARCSLQASSMVLLLSNDKYDTDDTIVEAAAANLALELSGQPDAQQLTSSCAVKLHVDVYNHEMMGWEPLIQPWASLVTLTMPLTRCDPAVMHHSRACQQPFDRCLMLSPRFGGMLFMLSGTLQSICYTVLGGVALCAILA